MADDPHIADLHARAAELGIEAYRLLRRDELIAAIEGAGGEIPATEASEPEPVGAAARSREAEEGAGSEDDGEVEVEGMLITDEGAEAEEVDAAGARESEVPTEEVSGILDLTQQRFGFLRLQGLEPGDRDVYISASQVRRCELRPGDEVAGPAREPRRGERHRALVHVDAVNGEEPLASERPEFDALPPVLPDRRLPLDTDPADVLARAVDLLAPMALGQRVLIRSAPRSGRTTLLRSVARAVEAAEGVRPVVLLVDERPEEATAWREALSEAELSIATADLGPRDQVAAAHLAVERARRLAEAGADVVLICDSLSRLAHASGEAAAAKRLFGSGRNLTGGGSLTVVATVLEGAADEGDAERAVITTESSLITLDADLAANGVFPALSVSECRVSNEEALREPEELEAVRRLRGLLADLDPVEAARLLRERIDGSPSNAELLALL
jgi:transcription termination factor Rho